MKYSIPMKFFAILLTALALVAAFGSALGIIQVIGYNLYTQTFDAWARDQLESMADSFSSDLLRNNIVREHSNGSIEELQDLDYSYTLRPSSYYDLSEENYSFTIYDSKENILISQGNAPKGSYEYRFTSSVLYPILERAGENTDELYGADYSHYELHSYDDDDAPIRIRFYESPEYTLVLQVDPEAMMNTYNTSLSMIELIYELRYTLILVLGFSLILFAVGAVYLCCAAGRSSESEKIAPGGLNRTPLDLYLILAALVSVFAVALSLQIAEDWYYRGTNFNPGTLTIVFGLFSCAATAFIGFCFACAAQFKCRNGFWWHHSVLGWFFGKLFNGLRFLFLGLTKIIALLPLIWKWLLLAAGMGLSLLLATLSYEPFLLFLVLFCCIAIVLYGGYAFGTLLAGAKRMANGDLNTKISTRFLFGSYAQCANHLNALADVAVIAAKNQMKSDRMKTELITNVSHDIKTPLTSIINYVDLLEKPHSPEEGQQYLEVLGRQSQRLKKLIEDLMDMSKATTGNMTVEITRVDAVEAVNQALGEFSDKLDAVSLIPVFRRPDQNVEILADGRLTWRVLSNLLSNVVKYALPGTRLYVDLVKLDGSVVISLKNISREELNISADELTERFVRGDASRNTEGSGLGLNIAKSLMELQRGQLQLLVDGDLFKVTLYFPAAQ